jgi:molecular chaperone GrpE (heat shock protein)
MLLTKEVVPQNQPLTAQEEKIDPMFKEFQEAETYYAAEVSEKVNLIKEMEGDEELLAEIEFLQLEYENLKKEMDAGADSQKIIAAMIENYRLRLNILEEILMELQDNRSDEKGGIYEAA